VAKWYERRFNVNINPVTEVFTLIVRRRIAHIPLSFVDPGDYVLVPDPGYPVYRVSTIFAGGFPFSCPFAKRTASCPTCQKFPRT